MDESTLEIKKYLEQLPPQIKTAVLGNEWHKRLGEIGKKYSLHLDQISSLEYEVLFVMIGMEPEEDLVTNIEKEVGVSKILAGQLAEEINTRIFQFILKSMQAQSVQKPERFEQSQDSGSKIQELKSKTPQIINESPIVNTSIKSNLLSEMEIMADKSTKETHEARTVEPPVNLPGVEEEENRDTPSSRADRSTGASSVHDSLTTGQAQQEIRDTNETKKTAIPTLIPPTSNLISQPKPSFSQNKLNTVVKSEEQVVINNNSQIQNAYKGTDPYREPVE